MRNYLDLGKKILAEGVRKEDRTGTGTYSIFGHQMRFDLSEGFPLVTAKKVPFRLVAEELFWFLRGSTNLRELLDKDVNIWNADAYRNYRDNTPLEQVMDYNEFIELMRNLPKEDDFVKTWGDLGRIYGAQWRSWRGVGYSYYDYDQHDQIKNVLESLRKNPDSRRHIVTAWNPAELDDMVLPPCHVMFQFYVANGKLSCQLYQRSVDYFLGLPFNIASYALLTQMMAQELGYEAGEFIHTSGDAHIYLNHVEQVKEMTNREPRPLPKLKIKDFDSIFDVTWEHLELEGYDPHPAIKGKVSAG